ncbi:nicotinate-nucleotide adenylyltransferase [Ornithinibacillus sp. L9]|uniref:Probable nicotinate-nucleotide adenylyltransferase n=1 Tax=Ornithinibacillus caprae TaxID=2678566 RepID=A0A6N8FD23_9BACI|nr:nicotinate-nucleotide adenylyltransferase [Ornithinibacillus caprae]MUK87061.1 nicotinate-nucleotide adenylyltransferase [Ornithinibacillus caprae]
MRRIGILGGTFDPPHIGHLIIAEEVRNALNLEEIWFIPTYEPPHKEKAAMKVNMRLAMLRKAIEANSSFHINTIEIDRLGKSYTFDTMKALTQMHKDTEFYFIIGGDMVEYLPHWYKIDELQDMISFVGVKRPGHSLDTPYNIKEVDIPLIDISSSFLRERLSKKESIRYFVPDPVYTFIKENKLYE